MYCTRRARRDRAVAKYCVLADDKTAARGAFTPDLITSSQRSAIDRSNVTSNPDHRSAITKRVHTVHDHASPAQCVHAKIWALSANQDRESDLEPKADARSDTSLSGVREQHKNCAVCRSGATSAHTTTTTTTTGQSGASAN